MSTCLFTLLLSLLLVNGEAQTEPANLYSKSDTMRAVEHLFDSKRSGGYSLIRVGVPLTLIGGLAGFLSSSLGAVVTLGQTKKTILPLTLAGSGLGLVPASIGLVKKFRFSRRRERAMLTAYKDGEPLPRQIQRRLKPKFFW